MASLATVLTPRPTQQSKLRREHWKKGSRGERPGDWDEKEAADKKNDFNRGTISLKKKKLSSRGESEERGTKWNRLRNSKHATKAFQKSAIIVCKV